MAQLVNQSVVELDYQDLVNGVDLTDQIQQAYGFDGVGVLTVKNVPDYEIAREKLLPVAYRFAALPDSVKEKYVHASSYYSFGWSHGKEKLQGKPDLSKGSYYANPQYDKPVDDEELINKYPSFIHPNIWPTAELPELETAFKTLGEIIVSVGTLVAKQCDLYVQKQCPTYSNSRLENIIKSSLCCKARLLHYFPLSNEQATAMASIDENSDDAFSSWCGWHNDHGSLTGLCSAMYLDVDGKQVQNDDPSAGLYVRNRHSELIKIKIPFGSIGFQIGETAQVHSGGILQATPHAVRGSKQPNTSRETFAVFMEPMWDEPMNCPEGVDPTLAQSQSAAANLPPGVPPLGSRWNAQTIVDSANDGKTRYQTFGEFSEATHKSYY